MGGKRFSAKFYNGCKLRKFLISNGIIFFSHGMTRSEQSGLRPAIYVSLIEVTASLYQPLSTLLLSYLPDKQQLFHKFPAVCI